MTEMSELSEPDATAEPFTGPRAPVSKIKDPRGREWEVWLEGGAIVARRNERTRVYREFVGYEVLPSREDLMTMLEGSLWVRVIEDEHGGVWLVSSAENGFTFQRVGGAERLSRPPDSTPDLGRYSDEELRVLVQESPE